MSDLSDIKKKLDMFNIIYIIIPSNVCDIF